MPKYRIREDVHANDTSTFVVEINREDETELIVTPLHKRLCDEYGLNKTWEPITGLTHDNYVSALRELETYRGKKIVGTKYHDIS